jgi:hypothetical protein
MPAPRLGILEHTNERKIMPQCDICSKSLSREEMRVVPPSTVVLATARGYVPAGLGGVAPLMAAFGVSSVPRADMWRAIVNQNQFADWGLCESCYSEITSY